jgi:hypothetical protein
MAEVIKIKRSSATASPSQLANGELAWTEAGNTLFIGSFDGTKNIAIGGERKPGTLTANQALVTNSTNMIDKIMFGNSTVNATANSIAFSLSNSTVTFSLTKPSAAQVTSADYFPASDGSWKQVSGGTTSPSGSNTQIQFNDSGSFGADPLLFWNKTDEALYIGNSTVNTVANSTVIGWNGDTTMFRGGAGVVQTSNMLVSSHLQLLDDNWEIHADGTNGMIYSVYSGNDRGHRFRNSAANYDLMTIDTNTNTMFQNAASAAHFIGNSTVNTTITAASLALNGTTVVVNALGAFVGANVNVGLSGVVIGNSTVNNFSNSSSLAFNAVVVANSSTFKMGNFTANNTLVNTAAINVTGQVNTATFYATTSANVGANVQLTTSALSVGNSTANLWANSILVKVANSTAIANLTPNSLTLGSTVVNSSQITVASGPVINATTITTTDLVATGNLTISGTLTTINTTNLNVADPLLFLADNGANQASFTDALDIGFVGQYGNTSVTQYTGFFRDASSTGKLWKLLDSTAATPAPTTTVDTSNTSFSYGILQGWFKSSGNVQGDGTGIFSVNSTGFSVTANSTWSAALAANTLSLSTALPGTSGGTGKASVTSKSLLVGNSSNGYDEVTFVSGAVLQTNSTAVFFSDTIDAGTF